jgi:hypothetical protein
MSSAPTALTFAKPVGASLQNNDDSGPCFDFSDLQALREEYEERIARLERDRDATIDVLKRDAENRISALRAQHDMQVAGEAQARQDLIEDLTIELASAREEGERTAREANARRVAAEAKLAQVRNDVARVEAEVARIREVLDDVLSAPAPLAPVAPVATVMRSVTRALPPPVAAPAQTSGLPRTITPPPVPFDAKDLGAKKRRIRLR